MQDHVDNSPKARRYNGSWLLSKYLMSARKDLNELRMLLWCHIDQLEPVAQQLEQTQLAEYDTLNKTLIESIVQVERV